MLWVFNVSSNTGDVTTAVI